MADDHSQIEHLSPERLAELHEEELEKLRQNIEALEIEISRREWRDMARSLDNPYQAPMVDPALPVMRARLAQRRAKLVEILGSTTIPAGLEDPGLSKEKPVDRATLAAQDVVKALVRKRALPVEDPLISEAEVEEEYEQQTGAGGAGSGSVRRGPVRSRRG